MPLPTPGQVINGFRYNGGNPNQQASWSKADDLAGAESRSRLSMGLAQAIEAHKAMSAQERDHNPLQRDWGAALLRGLPMGLGTDAAKVVGGQDYQSYDNAMRSYEAAILPILSGANITPTEAPRQQGALSPQLGDSVQSLHEKERNRAMQLNGAARSMGQPPPFPEVETFGVTNGQGMAAPQPQAHPQQGGGIPVYDLSGKRVR